MSSLRKEERSVAYNRESTGMPSTQAPARQTAAITRIPRTIFRMSERSALLSPFAAAALIRPRTGWYRNMPRSWITNTGIAMKLYCACTVSSIAASIAYFGALMR